MACPSPFAEEGPQPHPLRLGVVWDEVPRVAEHVVASCHAWPGVCLRHEKGLA